MKLSRSFTGLFRIARGPGSQTLATSLAGQALTLITGVIAARALGADGRGTLALLWLAPLTLVLLGGLGIPQAVTYYVARESNSAKALILMAFRVTVILAMGLTVAYGLGLWYFGGEGHEFGTVDAVLSLSLIPMFLFQNLGVAAFLGQERFGAFNATRLSPVLFYATVSLFLLTFGHATLTSILAAALTAWGLGAIATWVLLLRSLPPVRGEPDATSGDIVKFGLRGVVGSVSPIDDVRIDQFAVGLLLDARALGLYVAAVAFCNLPRFVAQSIGSIAFPRIAAAKESEIAWGLFHRYLKIGLLVIGVTVVGLLFTVPALLPFMFGDEFSEAVGMARILLLAAFFLSLHRLLIELARGLGHPGYGSITEIVNAAVFLLGVFLVLDPITVDGVAWSVFAGGVVSSSLLLGLILRLRRNGSGPAGLQEAEPEPLKVP